MPTITRRSRLAAAAVALAVMASLTGTAVSPADAATKSAKRTEAVAPAKKAKRKRARKPLARQSIIHGYTPHASQWPWMTAILKSESAAPNQTDFQRQFCGGTLIHPRVVLTAAHCVTDPDLAAGQVQVVLGRRDLDAGGGEKLDVSEIRIHGGWNGDTLVNDVALLVLARPSAATPARLLPQGAGLTANQRATVMGWGRLTEEGGYSSNLLAVDVPLISSADCEYAYSDFYVSFQRSSMMCAGWANGGYNTCKGDSGGPLMVKDSAGEWRLIGDVSWAHGCARAGRPTVFGWLNAPGIRPWIDQTVASVPAGAPAPAPQPTTTPSPVRPGQPGTPAPAAPAETVDRNAPALSMSLLKRSFRGRGGSTTVFIGTSEAANVVVGIERRVGGRFRHVPGRGLTVAAADGSGTARLRTGGLRRGIYRVFAVATDTAGNDSEIEYARFRIR